MGCLILASTRPKAAKKLKLPTIEVHTKGRSNKTIIPNVLFDAMVERTGLDMDELGAELRGRTLLRRIFPQVHTPGDEHIVQIQLGHHSFTDQDVSWGPIRRFDPRTMYKLDSRVNARYLAVRFYFPAGSTGDVSGYDLDLQQIAKR
jgi:hypothetical protein